MLDATELEILKWVRGSLYERRRDAVLAATSDMATVAEASRRQPDRRIEIVADILLGWKEHGPRYSSFLAGLDKVNVAAASAKITGIGGVITAQAREATATFGEAILPFCWEQVLKLSDELPSWKLETMLMTIGNLPTEASIEPLLWFIEQSSDPGQIDSAHQALLKLPYEGWKPRLLALKESLSLRTFIADDLLARIKAGVATKKP